MGMYVYARRMRHAQALTSYMIRHCCPSQLHNTCGTIYDRCTTAHTTIQPLAEHVNAYKCVRNCWRARHDVCRNPLLHFSEALALHVLRDHVKPLVLVLNKADLVPGASLRAWEAWFRSRYPGLSVVPCSAASQGEGAARSILSAVLSCSIKRQGRSVLVRARVGASACVLPIKVLP